MAKAVRMADIAERLGVSIVSVSKALAGKSGVSEEMRAKIEETAQEMGYQTLAARGKAPVGGSECIGVVVADRFFNENTFYSNLYRELLRASALMGVSVMMEIVMQDTERSRTLPNFILNHKADGVLFMGEMEDRYITAATQSGLPFVLLDFYSDTSPSWDSICSDNVNGGYQLTQHLIQQGRRRIAYVGSISATSSIMDRYLGYIKALLRAGIPPREEWRIEDRDADGLYIPLALPDDMPDAFVCNCDEVASHLVQHLQHLGYHVPRDIAVAGYDDFRFSTACRPPLTSYRVDIAAMAAAAVAQLLRKISGARVDTSSMVIPGSLIVRESTLLTP